MTRLYLDSYFGGSHEYWFQGLKSHSKYDWEKLVLPARNWKWHQLASGPFFSDKLKEIKKDDLEQIWVSDFVDLASLKGHLSSEFIELPFICYFHENQLTYPWSSRDQEKSRGHDLSFGMKNIENFMLADQSIFNSQFHRDEFIDAATGLLKKLPEPRLLHLFEDSLDKVKVIPVGINRPQINNEKNWDRPLILWNHRWEEDKNPREFLEILLSMIEKDISFEVALLGEQKDPELKKLMDRIPRERIRYQGFQEENQYLKILAESTHQIVTSNQDNFGISVAEALSYGIISLVPDRLAYHELFHHDEHKYFAYQEIKEVPELFKKRNSQQLSKTREFVKKFYWHNLIKRYDQI